MPFYHHIHFIRNCKAWNLGKAKNGACKNEEEIFPHSASSVNIQKHSLPVKGVFQLVDFVDKLSQAKCSAQGRQERTWSSTTSGISNATSVVSTTGSMLLVPIICNIQVFHIQLTSLIKRLGS